jgi:cathepsin X
MILARDCHPGEACFVPDSYYIYGVSSFDWITPTTGQTIVEAMKNELYQRGPIACSIHADQAFDDYTSGVFCSDTVYESTNHAISLVGWGVEDGQEYWLLRNSWGTYWGENGFAKLCTG